jgi:long-chain-fatty-acid--CoA ligase ACSBG
MLYTATLCDICQPVVAVIDECYLLGCAGTTGPPKAVMISHDNVTWTTANMATNYFDLNHTDRVISYLPLSHIAAQLIDIHIPMLLGACTYFCQPDALKGSLTVTMREVRPTIFFGVPRVWEKIQEKLVQMGRATTGVKKSISTWAKNNGTENTKRAQFGAAGGHPWSFGCANALVLSKIKEALGLDQVKANFTAAAPIAPETLWYFGCLNIPVYEVTLSAAPVQVLFLLTYIMMSFVGLWTVGVHRPPHREL